MNQVTSFQIREAMSNLHCRLWYRVSTYFLEIFWHNTNKTWLANHWMRPANLRTRCSEMCKYFTRFVDESPYYTGLFETNFFISCLVIMTRIFIVSSDYWDKWRVRRWVTYLFTYCYWTCIGRFRIVNFETLETNHSTVSWPTGTRNQKPFFIL